MERSAHPVTDKRLHRFQFAVEIAHKLAVMTTSEARQRSLKLVDEVEDGDQVIITKRRVPKAVIINFEQLQTLKAVARLWQDPEALRAMRVSLDEVKQGKALKLSGAPTVERILTAARKNGLLHG